jgi:hypothetical protein
VGDPGDRELPLEEQAMTAPAFQFDRETHSYTINGRAVPSVTGVISSALGEIQYGSEWHMDRGTEIHKAAEILLAGKTPAVDPRIQGRVNACAAFIRHRVEAAYHVEERVFSSRMMYGGTLDLIAEIFNLGVALVDWKSSGSVERTAIQLAGYGLAWQEMTGEDIRHGVMVVLEDSGKYKATVIKDLRPYVNKWRACLTVANIKAKL